MPRVEDISYARAEVEKQILEMEKTEKVPRVLQKARVCSGKSVQGKAVRPSEANTPQQCI